MRTAKIYRTMAGDEPYVDFLKSLGDPIGAAQIVARVRRIELGGNLGDHKQLGDGVFELRMHASAGYRVYFGRQGETVIVLLSASAKGDQNRAIKKAKQYWLDYLARKEH
ncbi:MAG: type II toxin-antitoxin system RelE/ParE family toxin [Nitrospinae bacterium]|nr:type II toxin-antitoxin system RelE/ParE family toxin [Nitrospinota bacterium]